MAERGKAACFLAALVLLLLVGRVAAAADPAGEVVALAGECTVESGGPKRPLKRGDAVQVGDTIEVPAGAKLKLRMADGSVISAAAETRLTIEAYADGAERDARLTLGAGLLRAAVPPVAKPSRFEVRTATGVAAVRSTDWFVEMQPAAMRVGVLVGTVTLSGSAAGKSVAVGEHRGVRLEPGHDPPAPRYWSSEEFAAVIDRTRVE